MNEGLAVFLNMDDGISDENNALIKKMEALLADCGMIHTGVPNIYQPVEQKDRDRAVFDACRVLNTADWLKDKLVSFSVMNRTNACSMEQIHVEQMAEPSAKKLAYYDNYYQQSGKLAHAVVVDENKKIRDGYISYLIAKKYGITPDIYGAFAAQPLRKVVRGQHVCKDGNVWKIKSRRIYSWNYTLKAPVVCTDILKVRTKKGQAFVCVCGIDYLTGKEFCKKHKNVVKHMGERCLCPDNLTGIHVE